MKEEKNMNAIQDITKKCILVKLSIGTYAGTAKCDKVAREAAKAHEAEEDAITATLRAMDPEDRKEIMHARNTARAIWLKDSLPWLDNGMRLVPVHKYLAMRDAITAKQAEFEDAVQKLVDRYDEVKAKVAKRLGKLEADAAFPVKEALARKFKFKVRTGAVNTDVRIDTLPSDVVEQIKAEQETMIREQLLDSQRDVLSRVAEKLEKVVEKLSQVDDPGAKGKHFKDSLTANVQAVCEEMKSLNVIGSAKLDATLSRIGKVFGELDPQVLRDSKDARQTVKDLAKSCQDEIDSFEF